MRWDRLFEELEAQAADLELDDRDALAGELRDGDWANTSWHDLLGGNVVLDVQGLGRLEGEVALVNSRLIQLRSEGVDHVVSTAAVLMIRSVERRADDVTHVGAALGWGHVFRALRDVADEPRVRLVDGSLSEGQVAVVGGDFVRLSDQSGRQQMVPFAAIAVISGRR